MFFASLGMALVDEGAATSAIGGVPSGAVVYLGTGDKSVASGANDIFVYASTEETTRSPMPAARGWR